MAGKQGKLGPETILPTADGPTPFAEGDRIQFTSNGRTRKGKDAGLVNGAVGTVLAIDSSSGKPRMTVALDGQAKRKVTFMVGDAKEAGEFNSVRHGYAGTIYKGQGRTLDQTYVFHSSHWRSASSYVALTRHRDSVAVFAARETTPDLDALARQMGRSALSGHRYPALKKCRNPSRQNLVNNPSLAARREPANGGPCALRKALAEKPSASDAGPVDTGLFMSSAYDRSRKCPANRCRFPIRRLRMALRIDDGARDRRA